MCVYVRSCVCANSCLPRSSDTWSIHTLPLIKSPHLSIIIIISLKRTEMDVNARMLAKLYLHRKGKKDVVQQGPQQYECLYYSILTCN